MLVWGVDLPHGLPSLILTADLHRLHLLLLFVAAVDRFPHRTADRAPDVLASMVVTQDIPRTDTMRHQALLIFALCNMLPQPLHAGAMRGHWTSPILVGTLGSVAEQEKTLLLMPEDLLPVRYFARSAATAADRPAGAAGWGAGVARRHVLLSGNLRRGRGDLRHTRLRWHRPLTAAIRHGIDVIHIDHVATSRPRGCRG